MEQVHHCIDLSFQVTFSAHTEHEKTVRVGMNDAAHQEKEMNVKADKRETGKENKSRSISKRLRAAVQGSFIGQYGENMISVKRVPGVTGILGKANTNSTQPKRGRGPHYHIEAVVN